MSVLRHSVLPLDVSVQQQLVVFLSVLKKPMLPCTYLFYNNLCCSRTYLFKSRLPWPKIVCSTAACAVPGGDWPTSRLCCTWTYLSTRAFAVLHLDVSVYESLCCAEPGRVCLTVHSNSCIVRPTTVDRQHHDRCLSPILLRFLSNPVAEFIDLWKGDEVSSGIGLSYRPPNHVIWRAMPVRQSYAGVDFIT